MFSLRLLLVLLGLLCAAAVALPNANAKSPAYQLEPNRWADIPRIVAFGDVHGAYEQLVTALQAANVIDERLNWSGGATHLVSLGDLLDRGDDSRAVMDLLIKLQTQAQAADGRVHMVIGNHELMNLTGDLRYVSIAEFAAFSKDEPDQERPDERFPPGYIGHRQQFAAQGRYGSWLLRQPLLVVLNENVFVHGGLPPIAARMSLVEMNSSFAADVAEILDLGIELGQAGWIRSDEDLLLQDSYITEHLESVEAEQTPKLAAAGRRLVSLSQGELFGAASPNWYRGTANCHQLLEQPVLQAALENLSAKRVVMGHTPTSNRRVQQRLNGHALLADTGMLASYYTGQPAPIIFTGSRLEILYPLAGEVSPTPDYVHPLQINGISPDSLEELLADAELTTVTTSSEGVISVSIQLQNTSLDVVFESASDRVNKQKLAAYRLSRLMNLNLVPVTVARTLQGNKGVLIALPERRISETARAANQLVRPNSCGVGFDYQLMYAFDALILNQQRSTETMIYDQHNWRLSLTGYAVSFGTGTGLPGYLASVDKVLPGLLPGELSSLNLQQLQNTLGAYLNKRQIRSLLKRRDRLLRDWHGAHSK